MVTLDIDREDCKNLFDMVDTFFFENLKLLITEDYLDNVEYVRSMLRVYDELKQVGEEENGDKRP